MDINDIKLPKASMSYRIPKEIPQEQLVELWQRTLANADKAEHGDTEAIKEMRGMILFFIRREADHQIRERVVKRSQQRKQSQKQDGPDIDHVTHSAARELAESDMVWDDMVAVMREEVKLHADEYNVKDPRTLDNILQLNRSSIEQLAAIYTDEETPPL